MSLLNKGPTSYVGEHDILLNEDEDDGNREDDAELQNVNFFTQIISVQLNLPQEKARKLREVFDILSIKWA